MPWCLKHRRRRSKADESQRRNLGCVGMRGKPPAKPAGSLMGLEKKHVSKRKK